MGEPAELGGGRAPVAQDREHVLDERVPDDVEGHSGRRIARGPGAILGGLENDATLNRRDPVHLPQDREDARGRSASRSTTSAAIDGIARVITDELSVEDRLNEEAREVLAQHMSQMERSDITYSEMFKKVKRELAKKKGIVL